MNDTIEILQRELPDALLDTALMVFVSTGIAIIVGGVMGLLLYLTGSSLFLRNKTIYTFLGFIVNMIRSLPFVILLVVLIPFTDKLVDTTIGPVAATVPLTIAAIAFFARLAESSFVGIDRGVLEAAIATGASLWLILREVLLPEALPSLIRGAILTLVSMIGYSAMAGIVGGGGIGDLAIQYGYYRYETGIMIVTVILLIALVQLLQVLGDRLAASASKN